MRSVHLAGIPLLIGMLLLAACGAEGKATRLAASPNGSNGFVVTPVKRSVSEADLAYYSPQMKAIYARGSLRVAMPAMDRKPFFYNNDEGVLSGSDVALAADMAAQLGVGVEYVRTADSFEEVVNQIASGQADVAVSKLSATLPRAQKVLFSNPYLMLHQGLLLNRLAIARLGSASQDPLEILGQAKVKIGVIAGTSYVSYANLLFPEAEVVQYATPQAAMDAAIQGEVAAIYYDELQLKQLLANNPDRSIDLQLHLMPDQVDLIAIAIPPDDVRLLTWVNLYLQSNQARIDSLLVAYGMKSAGGTGSTVAR
ncbi:ABC transporter substrate-binding protein [Cohnella nanjingensis]|uniref:Amino acid ABC transporter substrate-binding protein n=1 Tax=Cohnella nanjingensis TaxID=1387779 RepID=A0A7X0RWT9_9BACL|nr:ABC transporter substrate-binding protein [Cohnella nanjingensis]MBB6673755.1 amino acid ABC transporter substrate-binding protein [Cohnella nanjingensis]